MKIDFNQILDDEGQLSLRTISSNGLRLMLFPDPVDALHAELLCQAYAGSMLNVVRAAERHVVEQLCIEPRSSKLTRYANDSIRWTVISNGLDVSIFFREPLGDYYIVAGNVTFLRSFYPVRPSIACAEFVSWYQKVEGDRNFFQRLSRKYEEILYSDEEWSSGLNSSR